MSFPFDPNGMDFPGLETVLETVENQFWWGPASQQTYFPASIASTTRDAGNTVPTTLRGGLILGRIAATKQFTHWDPIATDGSETILAILAAPLNVADPQGTGTPPSRNRYTYVHIRGNLMSDKLIVPGSATEGIIGHAQEFNIVSQLRDNGNLLDQHLGYGNASTYKPRFMTGPEVVANAVTVTPADHGKTFNFAAADAATAVTLPTPQAGLTFRFVNPVAQSITITAPVGNIVILGSAAATAIVLTVGESCRLVGISSTLWYAEVIGTAAA